MAISKDKNQANALLEENTAVDEWNRALMIMRPNRSSVEPGPFFFFGIRVPLESRYLVTQSFDSRLRAARLLFSRPVII